MSVSTIVTAPTRLGWVDLTELLGAAVEDAALTSGFALAFCAHTTCALVINELEDGLIVDLAARLERIAPRDGYYAHDDGDRRTQNLTDAEPANGAAHIAAMVIGATSHAIPIEAGRPSLGRWQRLVLVELDEPRQRTVFFQLLGA